MVLVVHAAPPVIPMLTTQVVMVVRRKSDESCDHQRTAKEDLFHSIPPFYATLLLEQACFNAIVQVQLMSTYYHVNTLKTSY